MSDYFPPMILPTVFSWEGCESNLHMMFEPHQILSSIVESIEFIAVGKHYSHHQQDRRASSYMYGYGNSFALSKNQFGSLFIYECLLGDTQKSNIR